MFWPGLRRTEDKGPLVKVNCPHCEQDFVFRLEEVHESRLTLFSPRSRDCGWQLRCPDCGYTAALSENDCRHLDQLISVSKHLEQDEARTDEVGKLVKGLDLDVMKHIGTMAAEWTCPTCKEEVPVTFETCWNCGRKR